MEKNDVYTRYFSFNVVWCLYFALFAKVSDSDDALSNRIFIIDALSIMNIRSVIHRF